MRNEENLNKTSQILIYCENESFYKVTDSIAPLHTSNAAWIFFDKNKLKQSLQKQDVSVFYVYSTNKDEIYDVLTLKDAFQRDAQVILHFQNISYGCIKSIQENFEIFRVIASAAPPAALQTILMQATAQYLERKENKNIFIKYHQKNKKWKELSNKLNILDNELNQSLSRIRAEEKMQKVSQRRLQKFMSTFSYAGNMEEYTKNLFKEIRRVSDIASLTIFIEHYHFGPVLYSLHSSQFLFLRLDKEISALQMLNHAELREYMANKLNRPLLIVTQKNLEFKEKRFGFVAIESHYKQVDAGLEEFWKSNLQILTMILDRLLLRLEMESTKNVWEKTFEAINSPMVILDTAGKIIKMNSAFLAIQSYDLLLFLVDAHTNNKTTNIWKGPQQDYELIAYPIRMDEVNVGSALYYFKDLTEEKENYTKMVQNEKMSALGLLAGNIAHELNNPFAGLKSITQILLEEKKYDSYKEDFGEILSGVNRCLETIKNLQSFTADDQGKNENLNLSSVVEKTLPLLKSVLRSHQLHVDFKSKANTYGNLHLLQQVVFNLIHNACQAMKTNGHVYVRTFDMPDQVMLTIEDSGHGISAEDASYIFDPFFTTKKQGDGTGLGLSICKKIIESHNGKITFTSEVNKGTTFTISLPQMEVTK